MDHPCFTGNCRSNCHYGALFFECPFWQEWAAEQEEEDESDDDW